jgi:hypothetical protein
MSKGRAGSLPFDVLSRKLYVALLSSCRRVVASSRVVVRLFATAGNGMVHLVRVCDKCDITFCHSAVVGVQY